MKETEIIKALFLKGKEPKNDCYFLDGKYLVTTDSMSENTHFKLDWSSPGDVAWKLVEVNVSDIVAGGGVPTNAFLNLGLSRKTSHALWVKEFSSVLQKRLKYYSIDLSGGDTYFSETTNLTLTLIGRVKKPFGRTGGKPGNFLYMTGSVGLSAIGFKLLAKKISPDTEILRDALQKHLRPVSRLSLMQNIIKKYKISASMDISDGLIQDSRRLAKASALEFSIHIECLPNIRRYAKYIEISEILASGEELEILFLSPDKISHKNIAKIGEAKAGNGKVTFLHQGQKMIPNMEGFLHF